MKCVRRALEQFFVRPLQDLWRPAGDQIPALDFLRACAVLLVLAFHFHDASLSAK